MSLYIYAVIDTGGQEPSELGRLNITHNVRAQIAASGVDPWEWNGMPIADTIRQLHDAAKTIADPKRAAELRKLDAPNGWGVLEHSIGFVRDLLKLAEAHPKARWRVSR